MAEPVAVLLRRSLDHLASEAAPSHGRLLTELGSLAVQLDVDGELFCVRRDGWRLAVTEGARADAGVRISTSRRTVVDVLDGVLTLGDAVEGGRVGVRGSLDDVLRAHDALLAYVHAAVRAPSVPELVDSLRVRGGGG
jgi:hypothetical protein